MKKTFSIERLSKVCSSWKLEDNTIVLCHGCYDILHIGHVRHLEDAATIGDILVVTITADAYVNKGSGRPVFTAAQRAEMLEALECVDYVAINESPDACNVLRMLKPDFYVKGSDYLNIDCSEFQVARDTGVKMRFTNTEKFSTTQLIERVKKCL